MRDRGKSDAALVSQELRSRNVVPDLIISSPAKRAIKTARIFADNLGYSQSSIRQEQDIYDGLTTNEFIEIIRDLSEEIETVFFFGHNPGFYYYVAQPAKGISKRYANLFNCWD